MKTKHLILYNGRPYLADGEKPKVEGYAIGEVHASTASQLNKHEKALKDWENSLEEPENAYMINEFENGLSYKVGPKYIKITTKTRHQEMVWGFVMKADDAKFQAGDILKAAGWSAPARNKARGNIFGNYKIQWTGPNYLV